MAAGVRNLGEFGRMPDDTAVERYELDNGTGLRGEVLTLGGIMLRLETPDRARRLDNVLLGLPDVKTILSPQSSYIGALIGRFGNRIKDGRFTVDGKTYQIAINNGPNTLHGGRVGYDKRVWSAAPVTSKDGAALKLTLVDAEGTENYPGTVNVSVIYTLTHAGAWRIEYQATTDQPTPINLTQHAYFNLQNAGRSTIRGHELRLNCSAYTPSDEHLIPTGPVASVRDTPFDFRHAKSIGRDIDQLTGDPRGYDHNFVIDGPSGTLREAADVYEPTTGRAMSVWTTEPGVQFYSGNFLNGSLVGLDGFSYARHAGFCLETQHYPDSPNQPAFPNTILRPGETYRQVTEYRFGVR